MVNTLYYCTLSETQNNKKHNKIKPTMCIPLISCIPCLFREARVISKQKLACTHKNTYAPWGPQLPWNTDRPPGQSPAQWRCRRECACSEEAEPGGPLGPWALNGTPSLTSAPRPSRGPHPLHGSCLWLFELDGSESP